VQSIGVMAMKKHIFMAIAVSITCLFVVMFWAQADRFEAKQAVGQQQAGSSSSFEDQTRLKPIFD
jgi:hypothetical protein